MTDNLVNPAHYQKANGIETIDYIEAVTADIPGDEAVSLANLIKYVSRYRQKNPTNPLRDLEKARWYLNRLIDIVEGKQGFNSRPMTGLPEVAKNRKEDEEANAAVFKTNTARPGDVPGSRERIPVIQHCAECGWQAPWGAPLRHYMSCSEYTGHF
jgi:hypothetical protein